jgi:DNA recombination protein RmuC
MSAAWLLIGLVAGAIAAWLALRGRLAAGERAATELITARAAQAGAEARLAQIESDRTRQADAFAATAQEALARNNQQFLDLATTALGRFHEQAKTDIDTRTRAVDELVKPVREGLDRLGVAMSEIERQRGAAHAALAEQVSALRATNTSLSQEAGRLATALKSPTVRGRWGEIQLRRVVELAGMLAHCDFTEQEQFGADDRIRRPDLVVRLPGGKRLAVDAKAPLAAYLAALEAPDEQNRTARLDEHARAIRAHLTALGAKSYWDQFKEASPEFVVLFLPGETFFSAALERDPALIEFGVDQRVILATPTTLIALLRAVSYGWRQERLAENAQQVAALGADLHARLRVFADHFLKMKRGLDAAVDAYNQAAGSLESRVLVSARRLKELGAASGEDLPAVEASDKATRSIETP